MKLTQKPGYSLQGLAELLCENKTVYLRYAIHLMDRSGLYSSDMAEDILQNAVCLLYTSVDYTVSADKTLKKAISLAVTDAVKQYDAHKKTGSVYSVSIDSAYEEVVNSDKLISADIADEVVARLTSFTELCDKYVEACAIAGVPVEFLMKAIGSVDVISTTFVRNCFSGFNAMARYDRLIVSELRDFMQLYSDRPDEVSAYIAQRCA